MKKVKFIKLRKEKKGVELAMNTVVMISLALIAFLFILFFMSDKFSLFVKTTADCGINKGIVIKESECSTKGGTAYGEKDKEDNVCCVTQCTSMGGECKDSCEEDDESKYKCLSVLGCDTCRVLK